MRAWVGVNRTTIIVLVALGATFAGFVLASSARELTGDSDEVAPSVPAGPQSASLDWREPYGPGGQQLVFTVDTLKVDERGWRARVGVENRTTTAFELAPGATPDGTFGLRLFESGDAEELEIRNRNGTLPGVRAATRYDPELPRILEPGKSWEGEISAHGALVAGGWVRAVFGTLIAVGKPPEGLDEVFVWITDHAYRLQE